MSAGVEISAVQLDALMSVLQGDGQLTAFGSRGVNFGDIPQQNTTEAFLAQYPCVLIGVPVFEGNLRGIGPEIVWTPGRYLVWGAGVNGDFRTVEKIGGRIFQLLHGFKGPAPGGGYIKWCEQVRPDRVHEVVEGLTFIRVGGLYRVVASLQSS